LLAADGVEPPPAGQPCPTCGSIKQTVAIEIQPAVLAITAGKVGVEVIDYPHVLLQEAQLLVERQQHGIATMVAHVACEVTVLQALTRAFRRRAIPGLEEAMSEYFNGYNLGNSRLRGFYTALTGDEIVKQPFWADFKHSSERRNDFAHDGTSPTEPEARTSLKACTAFVKHVSGV
jgi:hypothetical protein